MKRDKVMFGFVDSEKYLDKRARGEWKPSEATDYASES